MKKLFQVILLVGLTVLPAFAHAESTAEAAPGSASPWAKCLPADVKPRDVVAVTRARHGNDSPGELLKITVEQKLNELKATCNRDDKLVDENGKQIVFYRLTGCWGNPPFNYLDILREERETINKLKQQYTVIEIPCSPSGRSVL